MVYTQEIGIHLVNIQRWIVFIEANVHIKPLFYLLFYENDQIFNVFGISRNNNYLLYFFQKIKINGYLILNFLKKYRLWLFKKSNNRSTLIIICLPTHTHQLSKKNSKNHLIDHQLFDVFSILSRNNGYLILKILKNQNLRALSFWLS